MARRTVYIDDLDGSDIQEGAGGPVVFSLRDDYYQLDLTNENYQKLADALAPYINRAEKMPAPTAPRATRRQRASSGLDLNAIRTWARENGMEVSDRGRVARNIVEAYEKAHPS